jgi:hypothetical protein
MRARAFLFALSLALAPACGGEGTEVPADAGTDTTTPEPPCFENPSIHTEIINACTTAQNVIKTPNLPLLKEDGSLPPLPP